MPPVRRLPRYVLVVSGGASVLASAAAEASIVAFSSLVVRDPSVPYGVWAFLLGLTGKLVTLTILSLLQIVLIRWAHFTIHTRSWVMRSAGGIALGLFFNAGVRGSWFWFFIGAAFSGRDGMSWALDDPALAGLNVAVAVVSGFIIGASQADAFRTAGYRSHRWWIVGSAIGWGAAALVGVVVVDSRFNGHVHPESSGWGAALSALEWLGYSLPGLATGIALRRMGQEQPTPTEEIPVEPPAGEPVQ